MENKKRKTMEDIKTMLQRSRNEMMRLQGTSSVAICKTKEEARNLLKAFNPSEQTALACNPTFCVTCEASRPVVSVEKINSIQDRVEVIEKISSI